MARNVIWATFLPRRERQVGATENHEPIIEVARQLFRERGCDGIGFLAAGMTAVGGSGFDASQRLDLKRRIDHRQPPPNLPRRHYRQVIEKLYWIGCTRAASFPRQRTEPAVTSVTPRWCATNRMTGN
jgi:hypothetical protein